MLSSREDRRGAIALPRVDLAALVSKVANPVTIIVTRGDEERRLAIFGRYVEFRPDRVQSFQRLKIVVRRGGVRRRIEAAVAAAWTGALAAAALQWEARPCVDRPRTHIRGRTSPRRGRRCAL